MKIEELEQIKKDNLNKIKFRLGDRSALDIDYEIAVCSSTCCASNKKFSLIDEFKKLLTENGLSERVRLTRRGCFGSCALGPIVVVEPNHIFYTKVRAQEAEKIVKEHILGGNIVRELLFEGRIENKEDIPFYSGQKFMARSSMDVLDPVEIGEYIAINGYLALFKTLDKMTPEEVIGIVSESGLRGRGGAGFSTGKKWEFAAANAAGEKYVVCNADEGDPGAFMDRSIIESNPHAIIEGMAIAGFAIGAKRGVVYVRAEYPLAGERISAAIEDARACGLLGKDIFGKRFDFDIEIKFGAGAFVCGEETALLNSVMGGRGEPITRPPYPAEKGLFGFPTVINNVETLCNIAQIVLNGAKWYNTVGTPTSTGTKVFALSGKVKYTGLVELPMGSTLNELVYGIGGGTADGGKFKAVQMGGPSGGCIPASLGDTSIDYESLKRVGSMVGSGGIIVLDSSSCMVDVAKFFLDFSVDESCGKCTPCRIGNKRMFEILEKITGGEGTNEDLAELEELAVYIKNNSLCGLGQNSPNPILSTLKYFRDEYEAHINGYCPAGVCKKLLSFVVTDKCIGCGLCKRNCPVYAISGEIRKKHEIHRDICIKCGKCFGVCPVHAIKR